MPKNRGIYYTTKKNGDISYRVSITYRGKHISLGSFSDEDTAAGVYSDARLILDNEDIKITNYSEKHKIPHDKFVVLINFRDNGIYFPTPIYLRKQYFEYYLTESSVLKFDRDDLFFYASHKIQKKGGYLFVSDYGSQYKILTRYGIRPFAVYGRDYEMINQDRLDYRYSNIRILNHYAGVTSGSVSGQTLYTAVIHINGNFIIGRYKDEVTAAIAYNKAVDLAKKSGIKKGYTQNYISGISAMDYAGIYDSIEISAKLKDYLRTL